MNRMSFSWRYFTLMKQTKEFIGKSRGDHNRLGIALQNWMSVFLGTFSPI
ncbi:DUF4158 domain-containing protein (plasmid) [Salmonella enterica subsp. enterica]|nr:DUF4158 domain-containing protein [Salmonella enterica subsp. enterica]